MQQSILTKIKLFILRNRQNRIFRKFVQVLCCMVVFVTTYALILPAITMEQDAFCGKEAHEHTEECLQPVPVPVLVCTQESLGIHTHSGSCYNADGAVICGQADYVVHSHSDSCYDAAGQLVCLLPERSSHVHGESCYIPGETQPEILHVHSEACYIQEQGELTCTEEEREGHSHGDQCYGPGDLLECTLTEHHVHDASCYSLPLTCSISTEPHVHSENCYGTGNLQCSTPEYHTHTDSCWDRTLSCNETDETHCHDDGCYTANLRCQIPENHAHSSSCYESILVCGKEAGQAHEHNDSCYGTEPQLQCRMPENHVHDTGCYNRILNCEVPEDPGHRHEDACYQWNSVLNCGLEEGQPEPTEPPEPVLACTEPEAPVHIHGDSCFELQEKTCLDGEDHQHTDSCYTCGLEAHAHTLICYSDPDADVESPEVWKATFAHVTLTGDWPTDVVAIAETQLGYTESTRNYDVWEDNSIHGYTRYGAWYGAPHGDWCGMFASFCLNYAEVKGMPHNYGVRPWIEDLTKLGLYYTAKETKAQKGNLIFFDWDADGLSDHVGIVAEVQEPQEHTGASVKTIEGNSGNAVRYQHYDPNDPVILGYGLLPGQERVPVTIVEPDNVPSNLQEILICGMPAHTHGEICYHADGTYICTLEEHIHTIDCVDASIPVGYADGGTMMRMMLSGESRDTGEKVEHTENILRLLTHVIIYNSNNEVVYESENGTGLKEVTIGENCRIKLTFAENPRLQFNDGNTDELYYTIPSSLSAHVVRAGVIRNRNGTIIATYQITDERLSIIPVLVEGKNFFSDFNNVTLEIELFAEVEHFNDSDSTPINFNGHITVEINQKEDPKLDILKQQLEYDHETQTISYISTVSAYSGSIQIGMISDWWQPHNASIVENSLQLKDPNGNLYDLNDWNVTYYDHTFELRPKNMIILNHKESITVSYQLKMDDNLTANFDFINTAYTDGYNNGNLLKDQDEIRTPIIVTNVEKDGVQKKETVGDVTLDVLEWTVKVDNLYQDTITITDQLGSGQTFCTHQPITIKSIRQDNTFDTTTVSWDAVKRNPENTQFEYTLPTLIFADNKNEYKSYVITYCSHVAFNPESPEFQTFENTVWTDVLFGKKPTFGIGTVGAIGVPYGIKKAVVAEDDQWITFTIDCIMPGTLYQKPNVLLYDSLGSWGNENTYIQQNPDSLEVTVTTDSGTIYTFKPYTGQESTDNTYLLVKNGPDFTMYFNTSEATPATSVWNCPENSTLRITYRVSKNALMLNTQEGYPPTGETLEEFLNRTNQKISNYAKLDYAPGYSVNTSVSHTPKTNSNSPLNKTAEIATQDVYEYTVEFEPYAENASIFDGVNLNEITSLQFIDTYDSRLDYDTESPLFVKVWAWGDHYDTFVFRDGKGPIINESGNTTTMVVNTEDLIGTSSNWFRGQSLLGSMKQLWGDSFPRYEFIYRLKVKDKIKESATAGILLFDNVAFIEWTDTIRSYKTPKAKNQVQYETAVLHKDMKQVDDSNIVEFTILVNHYAADLLDDGKDKLTKYYLYDKMSSNLDFLLDTLKIETLDVETRQPTGTISLSECQFEYDQNENKMTFIFPDDTVIRLGYKCFVKTNGDNTAKISNQVDLMGKSAVQDLVSSTFTIQGSNANASASSGSFKLIKKDATNDAKVLNGAKFKLYGDVRPHENATPDLIIDHHVHKHELFYYRTATTEQDGSVLIADSHFASEHLFALVEEQAPDGYIVRSEPYIFYWEETDDIAIADMFVVKNDDELTIPNDPIGYELPATGGTGYELYTVGGMLLILAAGILLYNQRKCRKEDIYSS